MKHALWKTKNRGKLKDEKSCILFMDKSHADKAGKVSIEASLEQLKGYDRYTGDISVKINGNTVFTKELNISNQVGK
jgi:hypothetical protein